MFMDKIIINKCQQRKFQQFELTASTLRNCTPSAQYSTLHTQYFNDHKHNVTLLKLNVAMQFVGE